MNTEVRLCKQEPEWWLRLKHYRAGKLRWNWNLCIMSSRSVCFPPYPDGLEIAHFAMGCFWAQDPYEALRSHPPGHRLFLSDSKEVIGSLKYHGHPTSLKSAVQFLIKRSVCFLLILPQPRLFSRMSPVPALTEAP